ncbi:MAG: ABC transporter substrate-binding protein [Gammaproteobacteria bacterium]|nr:ABC transporter substrate-binding protein [Gammaproteobacteria bacterium]
MACASGVALAQALAGCEWLGNTPVAIAAHIWPGYEPMFLAQTEGWLDASLVQLVEASSATESMQRLVTGGVQGAALTLDEVLKARAGGVPLSVVMVFDISAGADMLLARAGIKNLADLKGRRVGVEQGAVGSLMLSHVLRDAKLTKHDIEPVAVTIDKQLDAWTRNQVDAVVTYEPVSSKLLQRGAVKLYDSRQIPDAIVDVLAVRSEALDYRHATALRHLLAAYFRAHHHVHSNPHDAAYRMAGHLGLPEGDVLAAYQGLLLPDLASNRRLLSGRPPRLLTTARAVSALMVEEGLLPRQDTLTTLINADYLPYAA